MQEAGNHIDKATDRGSRSLSIAALVFVAGAAVMGWGASFVGLHEYGMQSMAGFDYWSAWLVPATFDGAAFACTLMTYRSSINGRSALRGRVLMWAFTAVSSWINWIHQPSPQAQIVAAGLPIAAVAVFDVVLLELRADYETRHGKRGFRLRPGLLALRWAVDRTGTREAFRDQVMDIPVDEIAGLGPMSVPPQRRGPDPVTGEPAGKEPVPARSYAVDESAALVLRPEGEPADPTELSSQRTAPSDRTPTVERTATAERTAEFSMTPVPVESAAVPAVTALTPVPSDSHGSGAEELPVFTEERAVSPAASVVDEAEAITTGFASAPGLERTDTGAPKDDAASGVRIGADNHGDAKDREPTGEAERGDIVAGESDALVEPQDTGKPQENGHAQESQNNGKSQDSGESRTSGEFQNAQSDDDQQTIQIRIPAERRKGSDRPASSKSPAPTESPETSSENAADADKSDASHDGAQTMSLPPLPDGPMTNQDKRESARNDYRTSLELEQPVSGAQLGKRYGLSEQWGRRQINAARDAMRREKHPALVGSKDS